MLLVNAGTRRAPGAPRRVLLLEIPLRPGAMEHDGAFIAGVLVGLVRDFFMTVAGGRELPVELARCSVSVRDESPTLLH